MRHQQDAEVYVVRDRGEWGVFALHDASGAFLCTSSLGTYGNIWPRFAREERLPEFVKDLEFDYFLGKTRPELYGDLYKRRRPGARPQPIDECRRFWEVIWPLFVAQLPASERSIGRAAA